MTIVNGTNVDRQYEKAVAPRGALPTAVLSDVSITASFIVFSCSALSSMSPDH